MNLTVDCPNCGQPMEFDVDLGSDPYPTSNPNHPLFSEPGDGAEIVDGDLKCSNCGEIADESWVIEEAENRR